jgi:hypothetical protein
MTMRRELCNMNGIQFSIRYMKQQRIKIAEGNISPERQA